LDRLRNPVITNAEYEDEEGQPFNLWVFLGCLIAAVIGGGVVVAAMAYCNRDKENPFEESLDLRIYVEGEDKITDVEDPRLKKW